MGHSKGGGSGVVAQAYNQFNQPRPTGFANQQAANQMMQNRPMYAPQSYPSAAPAQIGGMIGNIFGNPSMGGGYRPTGFAPSPTMYTTQNVNNNNNPLVMPPQTPQQNVNNNFGLGFGMPQSPLKLSDIAARPAVQPPQSMTGMSPQPAYQQFNGPLMNAQAQGQQWGHAGWLARGRQPYNGGAY